MKRTINIGIIGFGNIGSSVAKNLKKNSAIVSDRVGAAVKVVAASDKSAKALTLAKKMGIKALKNPNDIVRDPGIDIVLEAMGGENSAKKVILDAIKRGKHVVTSNKEVIAKHIAEILAAANKMGVSVSFEAAVGGATPIISPLRDELSGNDISQVYGIVNGTTNYILSMMTDHGMQFNEALASAMAAGYAERNPASDIEGIDSAYKSAIIATVAFGADIDWGNIYVEGISHITQVDIQFAREIGYVIKLLAVVKKAKGSLEVRVHPMLIPQDHQLASVSGNLNAIYIKGSPAGNILLSAAGAGGDPTSSAVMGDIIGIAARIIRGDSPVSWRPLKKFKLSDIEAIRSRYYIRLTAPDKFGVLAGISKAFADAKVSIQAVVQKETVGGSATIVILIHEVLEKNLIRAVAKIRKLSVVKEINNVIRVASE